MDGWVDACVYEYMDDCLCLSPGFNGENMSW